MAATVTLASTTLAAVVNESDTAVNVASTTGISKGIGLFVENELMSVVSVGLPSGNGTMVNVLRGRGATAQRRHSNGATVYIGRPDQFYSTDPVGTPGTVVQVSPYINTTNGTVWFPQGDEVPGSSNTSPQPRWWQLVTNTPGIGDLGVRTTTQTPTSSN